MNHLHSMYNLALLWTLWAVLHSLLISRSVTSRLQKKLGAYAAYYRIVYNIFSLLTLIFVMGYQLRLEEKIIFAWPWPWNLVKIFMYLVAFLLFYGGSRAYDMDFVIGIKQLQGRSEHALPKTAEFKTSGILQHVRHPWYTAAILTVWAFGPISDVSLVSKIILTVYIIIGTILEERKLINEFGAPYLDYRKRVPQFIPWKLFSR
jgi:protein-S-isoprenylcysteine O-methyltransferase Ste14